MSEPLVHLHVRTERAPERQRRARSVPEPASTRLVVLRGGRPSAHTCEAACRCCFLVTSSHRWRAVDEHTIDARIADEAERIEGLLAAGYSVEPVVADVFSWGGRYLDSPILRGAAIYEQRGLEGTSIAWTSGRPLLGPAAPDLLSRARRAGFRVVALTSHGTGDDDPRPQGAVKPSEVRRVVRTIHTWNRDNDGQFRISITFPIGRHNAHRVDELAGYAALLGARYVRFNRLLDLTLDRSLAGWVLDVSETQQVLLRLGKLEGRPVESLRAAAHPAFPDEESASVPDVCELGVMLSPDWGQDEAGCLGHGRGVNHCPGGQSMFGVIEDDIYPCSELLHRPIGRLESRGGRIEVSFDEESLAQLGELTRWSGYRGCIVHSMLVGGYGHDLFPLVAAPPR